MKYKTKVIRFDGGYTVSFTVGVQTFTLGIVQPRTKKEAEWYQKMLRTALDNLIANGMNSYYCPDCKKTVKRESKAKTIRSLCDKTGRMVQLKRIEK